MGFRKRKKSAALQSPTTPTFKTPGKPPRKLSRLSRLSSSRRTNQCNTSTNLNHCESSKRPSRKETEEGTSEGQTEIANGGDDGGGIVNFVTTESLPENSRSVAPVSPIARKGFKGTPPETTSLLSPKLSPKGSAVDSEDTDDDDIGLGVRKRKKARVLMSPLSQVVKSPDDLKQRVENRLNVQSGVSRKVRCFKSCVYIILQLAVLQLQCLKCRLCTD